MYHYIAQNNPSMAKAICHKYGYEIVNVKKPADLGICLEQVVSKEGEPALKDIVLNHPDRDLILEVAANENFVGIDGSASKNESKCDKCKSSYNEYMNFVGEEKAARQSASAQTNTYLLASAFLLGIAIIATKM